MLDFFCLLLISQVLSRTYNRTRVKTVQFEYRLLRDTVLSCDSLDSITRLYLVVFGLGTGYLDLAVLHVTGTRLAVYIVVACNVLIRKIEQQGGIDALTKENGLEVQVRACRTASIAAQAYRVTRLHILVLVDKFL